MQISKPLSYNHNFCNSLSCPTAPTGMKYADVTPIHQKDDKTDKTNYCSVSILRTLESRIIVPTPIVNFFSTQDVFIPTRPIINLQSFLPTFLTVNSHFHHNPS